MPDLRHILHVLNRKRRSAPIRIKHASWSSRRLVDLSNKAPAPIQRLVAKYSLRDTMVPMAKVQASFEAMMDELPRPDGGPVYLEFGVNQGSSMVSLCRAAKAREGWSKGLRVVGFDSFEGLPPETADDVEGPWQPGEFASSMSCTRNYLKTHGVNPDSVELVKGWFKDTLHPGAAAQLGVSRFDIAMIDCDIYTATVEVLAFLAPIIANRCFFVFDDWNATDNATAGEKKALKEFQASHPHLRLTERPELAYNARSTVFEVLPSAG